MNEEQQKLTLFNRILNGIKQVPETVIDKGSNLYENIMFGREVKEPESSIENKDGNVAIQTGVNNGGRKGGLVGFTSDVVGGAKENMNTTFKPQNLYSNDRKGFGYRLGEGLGSAVRLLDNPLVRGAVAYGLSKHMGDSNPLEQGLIATGTNMRNKAVDRVYRNDLINSRKTSLMNNPNWNTLSPEEENEIMTRVTSMAGYSQMQPEQQIELLTAARTNYLNNRQQEQIRAVENEINGYRGFIDNNIYDNMIKAQQLRDNAEYRQMYFDAQQRNLEAQRDWQRQQAEKENQLRAQQLYLTDKGQRLNYEIDLKKLKLQEEKLQKGTAKFRTSIGDKKNALQQIKAIRELVKNNPNATGYIVGKFAKGQEAGQKIANEFLSKNPEAIKTRAAISKLRGTTMHDLAGTAQTLQEQRNLAPFLPDSTDNHKTILSKLDQLESELLREMQTLNNTGMSLGYDIDDMNYSYPTQQPTTENQPRTNKTKSGVKYEVIN